MAERKQQSLFINKGVSMNQNLHKNHRQRMFDRYAQDGFSNFEDHEILEMLLYFSIPRRNTNDIGHALLNEFGSFKAVMDADYEMLMRVDGVGPYAAFLIKLISEAARRYALSALKPEKRYTEIGQIALMLHRMYIGVTREQLYMLLFNNRMNLLDRVLVSEGGVTSTNIPLNKVNDLIVKKKAAAIILVHNHPDGLAVPSQNDLDVTDAVRQLLEAIDITLVEHLIIADNRFYPIMKHRYGMYRTSPVNNRVESGFYEMFYNIDEATYTFPPVFDDPRKDIE